MNAPETDPGVTYVVVRNHEEQYSIWPANRTCPAGWTGTGFSGPRDACLAHIAEVWTDMRPRSLRSAMERATTNRAA